MYFYLSRRRYFRTVVISMVLVSILCTGHAFATANKRSRCCSSKLPVKVISLLKVLAGFDTLPACYKNTLKLYYCQNNNFYECLKFNPVLYIYYKLPC